jgi:hypothetical protein
MASIMVYCPYNSTTRLWFNATDPAVQFLNGLIPPLQVGGVYLHNVSVMLVLLLILSRKTLFGVFGFFRNFDI